MLELQNLTLTVTGEKGPAEILKNINVTLHSRRMYAITGPNGSGKTSLVKTIMGIYRPTSGRILLNGQDITNLEIAERAKLGIGYAFQQPPRFKGLKIKDLLALAAGTGLDEKTCGLLYEVGLCPSDYLEREVDASLSGGELKRIEIATLLARKLAVAIYDEPEAGIDLWSFGRLTDTFRRLHRETTATYVIISHQERLLEQADEIILMVDGMIREMGRKEEIWPQIVNDAACACGLDCAERRDTDAECYR
ncbi:MAG: ABC transporter ATP-binding protein [bacterium]